MKINYSSLAIGLIIGLIVGGFVGLYFAPRGSPPLVRITTAGSTTVFPLSTKWGEEYEAEFPGIQVQVAAGGSGLGQSQAAEGIVDIGASSSYPSESYFTTNPTVEAIPVAADALAVVANDVVNGTDGLRLNRTMVVSIFNGSITDWGVFETTWDVEIAATGNIEVYVRSDASGTTATFGGWLEGDDGWTLGHSETVSWPGGFHAVDGNQGVKSGIQADTNGAIGYVGLAFTTDLTAADLYNEGNGEWVTPTADNAKTAIPETLSDPGASLMDSSIPGAYPIVRLLFYLVNTEYIRQDALTFVEWCLSPTGQNPEWIQTAVGYLEITGTGAIYLAQSIVAGITPVANFVPLFQPVAIFSENEA
jgi:phosphate transport system substrate-binding protein